MLVKIDLLMFVSNSALKIARIGIVNHVNLNVAEQLQKYKGPILLIRRRSDEMITTDER